MLVCSRISFKTLDFLGKLNFFFIVHFKISKVVEILFLLLVTCPTSYIIVFLGVFNVYVKFRIKLNMAYFEDAYVSCYVKMNLKKKKAIMWQTIIEDKLYHMTTLNVYVRFRINRLHFIT